MALNIQLLENRLLRYLHGTTLDQVTNPLDLIYDSAQQLILDIDPQETKVIAQIPIFNGVYDYTCPTDLKGNGAIDIAPQVNRQWSDYYSQQFNQDFDLSKLTSLRDSFTVLFNSSTKSLRINAPTLPPPTILNQASGITNNGTWAVDGVGCTNLIADNTNFVAGAGSLQFNFSAGQTTGYLELTGMNAVDITSMLNQGYQFFSTYLQSASHVSNVNLRWGQNVTNYYSQNITLNQLGKVFNNGWNLLDCPWLGATVTGSPTPKITYLRVTFTYDGTAMVNRINNFFTVMPLICNLEYYSKYLFRDGTTGIYQEVPTDPSNLINLDTESFNLLAYQCGLQMAQQQQGVDALFYDANYFSSRYDQGIERYKALYKSEKTIPTASYYILPKSNYGNTVNSNTFWGN